MIRKIQEKGAIVAIAEVRAGVILAGYSKEYRRLAKKYRTILIPNILDGILTNPSLKSDYIHPNAEGYKVMAERILKAIQPVVQKNAKLRYKMNSIKYDTSF
jgi:hypothetical protein